MNIIIVSPDMGGFGGTETVLSYYLDYFKKKEQYQVKLLIPQYTGDTDWIKPEWDVEIISDQKLGYLKRHVLLKRYFKKNNDFDISISLNRTLSYEVKKFLPEIKCAVFWHHFSLYTSKSLRNKVKKILDKILIAGNDRFWAISSGQVRQFLSLGIPNEKIELIFNPLEPNFQNRHRMIKRAEDNILELIYIGRLQPFKQKNLVELFQGLSRINDINWRLRLFGHGNLDDINELKKQSKSLGINGRINFEGFKKNPWNEVVVADAMVLTSKYEGFPMSIIESISRGLPVISSDCPTGPEDLVNEKTGYLYKVGDLDDLELTLRELFLKKNFFESEKMVESLGFLNYELYFEKIENLLCNNIYNYCENKEIK